MVRGVFRDRADALGGRRRNLGSEERDRLGLACQPDQHRGDLHRSEEQRPSCHRGILEGLLARRVRRRRNLHHGRCRSLLDKAPGRTSDPDRQGPFQSRHTLGGPFVRPLERVERRSVQISRRRHHLGPRNRFGTSGRFHGPCGSRHRSFEPQCYLRAL